MAFAIVKFIDDNCPSWQEYALRFLSSGIVSRGSIRGTYGPAINDFTGFVRNPKMSEVTVIMANDWAADVRKRMSHNSIISRVGAIRSVFSYAVKEAVIVTNPFAAIKVGKPTSAGRVLSDHEIVQILRRLSFEAKRMVMLALYTGMRRGELASLQWKQVGQELITIPAEKSKSKRERTIVIHPEALLYLGKRGRDMDYVFSLTAPDLNREFTEAWRAAEIGRVRVHDLRHTWLTRFLENSGDLPAALDQGGWKYQGNDAPYQHITMKRKRAILGIAYSL